VIADRPRTRPVATKPTRIKRFEQRPGLHTPTPIRGGVIVLLIFGALLYWAYTGGTIPFLPQGGYDVKAEFTSGYNLLSGRTPVRVGGIDVGLVSSVQRTAAGNAVIVTMHITNGNVHVMRTASAQIYWRTLLGFQYYIQINPGTGHASLGNATIPPARTGVQVEADQVLQALTPPSRVGIQQVFAQFAKAFAAGTQAGNVIDASGPALSNVAPALDALQGTQPGDLTNTVDQASRLVTGLKNSDATIGDLVGKADSTFAATDAAQSSIAATLQQGAETLTDTQTTMTRVNGLLSRLNPVADNLQPGARALAPAAQALDPALRQLIPLLDTTRPTLASLRPALRNLNAASRIGTPLLSSLTGTFGTLNTRIIPPLNSVNGITNLKMYETIGPTAAAVEDSASEYDVNGYIQRFEAINGGANTLSAIPCGINNLTTLKITCSDFQTVIGNILGLGQSTTPSYRRGVK
jgi:phospholipid/cholesterol/gamma-HCH transport system substrate-binding protein